MKGLDLTYYGVTFSDAPASLEEPFITHRITQNEFDLSCLFDSQSIQTDIIAIPTGSQMVPMPMGHQMFLTRPKLIPMGPQMVSTGVQMLPTGPHIAQNICIHLSNELYRYVVM